jgi:endo-1,4-beta-xylanase
MRNTGFSFQITTVFFFLIVTIIVIRPLKAHGQFPGIEDSIRKYRKGVLIVKAKPGTKVSVAQTRHEFWFGCAITSGFAGKGMPEGTKKMYGQKFLENFNAAVTENAVKWPSMEPRKGEISYAEVDTILKWTEKNHIPLRGHNLFWGITQFIQPWVKELNDDELRKTIQKRAEMITDRYRGRFAEFDLNNEMVHGNYYEERLGPEITKQMAEWAHDGDPDARLFLNDYDILTGNKLPEYMAQIRKFLSQGIPIAGIGAQGHLHAETFDRQQLKNALDSLFLFHLPVRITEFNMPGQRSRYYRDRTLSMTPEEEEKNAKEIVDYYTICFAHPAVEGILMWGFWAGANWIPVSSLYRRDWSETPSAKAYSDLIFHKWWISDSGIVGKDGTYPVSAFFGNYKVTVDGVTREVQLTKKKGNEVVDFTK